MCSNQVWTLVDLPANTKQLGSSGFIREKKDQMEESRPFKARLVVKGYTQKAGIDYGETFLLVAMLKSIWILLSIAAHLDYEIWQMDVKTAFLNGHLKEDIYMM